MRGLGTGQITVVDEVGLRRWRWICHTFWRHAKESRGNEVDSIEPKEKGKTTFDMEEIF